MFDGETGETVFRETLFPDAADMALLSVMWLDNRTLIFTHSLDGTPYTLSLDSPTPRPVPRENIALYELLADYNITMAAALYHFGEIEPNVLQVRQFSPISNSVPPTVTLGGGGNNNGYLIGVTQ